MTILNSSLKGKLKAMAVALFTLVGATSHVCAQTINSSSGAVCEGDPVQLEVTGFTATKYQWFVNGVSYKVTMSNYCTIERAELSGGKMSVGVAAYPSTSPTVTKDLTASSECKASICDEAATGGYIFGTDFSALPGFDRENQNIGKEDVYNSFADNIGFKASGKVEGNDHFQSLFGGKLPSTIAQGADNEYLFPSKNQAFEINFGQEYMDKPFRVRVRLYFMFKCEQHKALVKMNGKYGSQVRAQQLSARVYRDGDNSLVGEGLVESNDQPQFELNSLFEVQENVLYRADVDLTGIFARIGASNELVFEFEGTDCLIKAVDFISFESENVCVTPRTACKGQTVTVSTAGFAYGKQITWQKKSGSGWINIPADEVTYEQEKEGDVNVSKKAYILMKGVGAFDYRVISNFTLDGENKQSEVKFTLVGEDCGNNACVSMEGPKLYCLYKEEDEIFFTLKDREVLDYIPGDKYYDWRIYGPDGKSLNGGEGTPDARRDFSKKTGENGEFHDGYDKNAKNDEGVTVWFSRYFVNEYHDFSEDNDNKKHKVILVAMDKNKVEICKAEYEFQIVRDPLMRNFQVTAPSISAGQKLCAADLNSPINLQVKGNRVNGEPVIETYDGFGYKYTWYGAMEKNPNNWEATLTFDKTKACGGIDKKYVASVTVDNLGCSRTFTAEYEVTNPESPTIECPIKQKVVLELGPGITTREFKLPIIDASAYTVVCGSSEVNVYVDDVKNVMGSTIDLEKGVHVIKYVVKDGCGKEGVCSFNVEVIEGIPPAVDCSKILPISKDVEDCKTNIIVQVPDVSEITEEENVVVSLYGWVESKTDPGLDPSAYTPGSQPVYYNVGNTYLLWAFADTMGNTSYCSQKISVNDNRDFEMECKTSLAKNDTVNVCNGKSWAEIKTADPSFVAKFPTASYKECGSETEKTIEPTLSFKLDSESEYKPLNDETLLYNKVYHIRWTFTKEGDNIVTKTEHCYAALVLLDNEAPIVNCDKYASATVLVNYNPSEKEGPAKYMKYASGKYNNTLTDPKAEKTGFVYTLADKLFYPVASDISDNCTDPEDVVVNVVIEDWKGKKTTINDQNELDLFQFVTEKGQGEYEIHFTFTDTSGNVAKCEQEILVVESFKPVPNCPSDVTLQASLPTACNATYTFAETPTARMDYWIYTKDNFGPAPNKLDGPGSYNTLQGSAVSEYMTIYPYKLVKLNGTVETLVTENSSAKEIVESRFINGGPLGKYWWDNEANPDKTNTVNTNDFTTEDKTKIQTAFSNLAIGTHAFRWYYINNEKKESYCDFIVTVEDKTPPSFTCPTDTKVQTAENATSCGVTIDMKVYQPTEVKDCDSELSYAYEIKKGSTVVVSKKKFTYGSSQMETLEIGTYTITWFVSDSKNNEDQCSFVLQVEDKTKPSITCPGNQTLKATANCVASYTVAKSKFSISDNCTDVVIYSFKLDGGTEVVIPREQTKVTISGLKVGEHNVVWTAKDLAQNLASCTQQITVTDNSTFEITCPESDNVSVQTCEEKLTWSDLKDKLGEINALPSNTDYVNCVTNTSVPSNEKIEYSEHLVGTYSEVSSTTEFDAKKTYDIRFTYTKEGDFVNPKTEFCEIVVYVGDTTKPVFNCNNMENLIELSVVEACDTLYRLLPPVNAVSDVCTKNKSDFKWYYSIDEGTEKLWSDTPEKLNVGVTYQVSWRVEDKDGNSSTNSCPQSIRVRDKRKFDLVCPSEDDIVFNWCETQVWYTNTIGKYSVRDSLLADTKHWPKASAIGCQDGLATGTMKLDSIIYVSSDNGTSWNEIENSTKFVYGTQYKIKWVYSTQMGEYVDPVSDVCIVNFKILDTEAPKENCDAMKNKDVFIKSSACDTTFVLEEPKGVFSDNCGVDRYGFKWKFKTGPESVEYDYNSTTAKLTFQPGVYTITWWAVDRENNKSKSCDQILTVRDSSLFNVSCPNTENDKVYDVQVCEAPSGALLLDSLTEASYSPKAEFTKKCAGFTYPSITETVYIQEKNQTTWNLLKNVSSLELKKEYNVKWIFSVAQSDVMAEMADSCEFAIRIGDVTEPEFTCPKEAIAKTDVDATDCIAKMSISLSDFNPVDNCEKNPEEFTYGYYINGYSEDTTYVSYSIAPIVVPMPVREEKYTITWVVADKAGNRSECNQTVTAADSTNPSIECPDAIMENLSNGCTMDLTLTPPTVNDNCGVSSIYYSFDGKTYEKVTGDPINVTFAIGESIVYWYAVDAQSNSSDTCKQSVTIKDNEKFDMHCPKHDDGTFIIEACDDLTWKSVRDSLTKLDLNATAEYVDCKTNTSTPIDSVIMKISLAGADEWSIMTEMTDIKKNTEYDIRWVFTKYGKDVVTQTDSCQLAIMLKDTTLPIFDCASIDPDSLVQVLDGICDVSFMDVKFKDYYADDNCDVKVKGVLSWTENLSDSIKLDEKFKVGKLYEMHWIFQDKTGNKVTCGQKLMLNSNLKSLFDCDSLHNAPIEKVLHGVCQISPSDLNINTPFALDACTKDTLWGEPSRKSGKSMSEDYQVGRDTIVWHFSSIYSTEKDSCEQYVFIQSDLKPIFDCDSLHNAPIVKALDRDQCNIAAADLNINTPFALDACTRDTLWGVGRRTSGKAMGDLYSVGRDTIVWVFTSEYTITMDSCEQYVDIKDTIAPAVDCSIFEDVSILWTELGDVVPYEKVVANGMIVNPSVMDACDGEIFGNPVRSDGLALESPFALDTTVVVTWTFVDASGNDTACSQNIHITNLMDIPIECPTLQKSLFSCEESIPSPYSTWEEFKAAGGSAEMEKYLKPETFGSVDTITGQCTKQVKRTYYIIDMKGARSVCDQNFTVVDTMAPEIITSVENLVLGCKDDIPEAPQVFATDACQNGEILAQMVETNDRSTDSHSCGYYNYTITRTWTATDSCGNVSSPLVQTITVVDSVNPHFELPADWRDTLLADVQKPCMFKVPDFYAKVRPLVNDNCTELEDLKVWQVPAAGTRIYESITVKIYVQDFCENTDSISIFVMMTPPEMVVAIDAIALTTCVSDTTAISLWSQDVRVAHGNLEVYDWDGTITSIPSTFTYDCYLNEISESALVFSDNFNTYADKYYTSDRDLYNRRRDSLINLTRRNQSGLYYFVAMDTITLCSDTASAYLDLREKPRISMNSGDFSICEYDSLPLNQILTEFGVCVDDMGYPLTEEGWMIDGIKYTSTDSVFTGSDKLSLYYYAENECGMTNSLDSYFGACFQFPVGADSVEVFGSEMNVKLYREDRLKVSSSIVLDVHRRFDENSMMLVSDPPAPATLFIGDNATLTLNTDQKPSHIDWYRVVNHYDARFGNKYNIHGELLNADLLNLENDDELIDVTDSTESRYMQQFLYMLSDSANYYAVVSDYVCPSMSSNVVSINVNDFIPTAITPYDKDGMNDVFMPNCYVVIFNRYGQRVHEGMGWDGSYDDTIADPGVYFYELVLPNGAARQGTIEVVRM
ncbi:MAG: gliding motility-associated C-terminal domain-containing protein [Paludibacteraceae bacterium]|nr:gliding motility-associated C-terminal domain-containing protein [Paludibacteraceae bacterium]